MNPITNSTCLSLRNNAACCIPLRHLRYLRENNTEEDSINIPRRSPKCLSLIYADKQQNSNNCNNPKQPVFLCVIMQLAAFLCMICVICGRITRKRTQSIYPEETPNVSR